MKNFNSSSGNGRHTTAMVRARIESGGERIWRLADFHDFPSSAVAQALSRLSRDGFVERLSKGIYYRRRDTAFGKSRPNPTAIRKLAATCATVYPSGLAAANLLSFTTQTSRGGEVSTSALSLPRKLIGSDTVVHTRRPEAWVTLTEWDAALLEFLRTKGTTSELSPQGTVRRILTLLAEPKRFEALVKVAASEPPRVRAMLGAIGQELGKDPKKIRRLRASLNPLSQFDFGKLAGLAYARDWQAKHVR